MSNDKSTRAAFYAEDSAGQRMPRCLLAKQRSRYRLIEEETRLLLYTIALAAFINLVTSPIDIVSLWSIAFLLVAVFFLLRYGRVTRVVERSARVGAQRLIRVSDTELELVEDREAMEKKEEDLLKKNSPFLSCYKLLMVIALLASASSHAVSIANTWTKDRNENSISHRRIEPFLRMLEKETTRLEKETVRLEKVAQALKGLTAAAEGPVTDVQSSKGGLAETPSVLKVDEKSKKLNTPKNDHKAQKTNGEQ